jgi:plastocyanin
MKISSSRFVLVLAAAVSLIGYSKPASATTVDVTVGPNGNLVFSPSSVTIHPGDQVRWTWGSSGHSTTSGSPGQPNGIWDSGIRSQGATFIRTFSNAGTFPYYCTPHGGCCGMTGTVVVAANASPAFFTGEIPLGNGVFYLQFSNGTPFGYYAYLSDPHYIYHYDMGYEYWFDANDGHNGIYFYDFAANTFFYTSPSFPFPYLYDFGLNALLYYYPDTQRPGHYTTNPRYFFNFATQQIITR